MSPESSPANIDPAQAIVAEQQLSAADYSNRSRVVLGAVAAVELGIVPVWVGAMAEADLSRPIDVLGAAVSGYAAYRSAKAGYRNAGSAATGNRPSKK